jgi:transcriptional regulator with XRE-family HTH domain
MNEAMQRAKAKVRIHRLIRQGRLAEVRADTGLSQEDVAAALGVTQSAVSRWETGDTAPRARRAAELVELLDGDE